MQLLCGQCGHTLDVDEAKAGPTVDCWHCGRVVPAPRPDDVDFEASLPAEVLGLKEEVGFAVLVQDAMKQKIRVACGSCGKTLTVSFRMAGRKARCPACGERLRIPFPGEEEEVEVGPPEPAVAVDEGTALEGLAEAAAGAETGAMPSEALARAAAENEQAFFDGLTSAEREEDKDRLDLFAALTASRDAESFADVPSVTRAAVPAAEKRMTAMGLGIAAVVILAIGVGVWVGKMLWSGRGPDEPIQPGLRPEPPAVVQKPGPDVEPQPPKPKPPKPKPPPVPTCVVVAAWNAPFAAAGYTPARRGRHFRKISATVKAGTKPVSFKTAGPDVMLRVGVEEFTSLGSPPQGNSLAMRPKIAAVKLKPRKSERLTFVFDLPADLDGTEQGILTIRGIEPVDVPPMASRPPARPPEKLTTYVEAPPRNLRPLLRDPVMAAIQAARNQKLFLRRRSEELSISIPAAGVSGTARKLRDGHYQVMLKRGAESLQCLLRLFDRGHRIVLYLADEPFHQITYVHPKWTGETKTYFKPPEPDRPKAPDVPKRREQPPSAEWPVKKHMPDFDPNQKSIFD